LRLHPLGLFVSFITGIPQLIFPMFAALFGTRDTGLSMPMIIGTVLLVSLVFRWIAWLRFRYYIDDDDIRIEQGLLNRTARSIPFDRIQDVSIEQKLLARLFNLGEVKFETGGGKGDDAKLSFVSLGEAERLRETIKARKSGDGFALSADQETERPPVFAMDSRRLVTLGLYSFSLVIFTVLGGLAQQFDFLLPFDLWDFGAWTGIAENRGVSIDSISLSARIMGALVAVVSLILIGFATGIARTFIKEYGFRLDRTEKGFRRRRGLFTRSDVVMPVHRVQAAIIATGPIRKRRGWHALKFVSLAQDSKEESDHMVAPLASLDEIWPILSRARLNAPDADLAFVRPRSGLWFDQWLLLTVLIAAVVIGLYAALGILVWGAFAAPILLGLLYWLDWWHRSDAVDDHQLYARHGWWRQQLDIARQVNVQSVSIRQGPLTRRRGVVTLDFGIAGGTLSFTAIPLAQAMAIRDAVMDRVAPVDFSRLATVTL
jgi:putative membrane protein